MLISLLDGRLACNFEGYFRSPCALSAFISFLCFAHVGRLPTPTGYPWLPSAYRWGGGQHGGALPRLRLPAGELRHHQQIVSLGHLLSLLLSTAFLTRSYIFLPTYKYRVHSVQCPWRAIPAEPDIGLKRAESGFMSN